ncbi:unnamed protein product [Fusarium equiseti]|uniref:Histone H2A/H2B/H3 domain-containing protein n=1 Tax=Fusarium equiseti TaxID=61235 RepID=A0A8J2JAE5_FUSEQ|nr:unnamed protein product [Fusarium equiseti]
MVPQKTVAAKSSARKALLKTVVAREKGGRQVWAKGAKTSAIAGKRFDYYSDPFTLLVMKILKEQNPTTFRSIRIKKAIIEYLKEFAEERLVSFLEGVAVLAEHAGRKAPSKKDFETLKSLHAYVK